MPEDITLEQYTMRYIKHCEDKMIDFDEIVFYNIIKLRFGVDAIISAKTLVQKCLNNTDQKIFAVNSAYFLKKKCIFLKITLDIWLQNAYIKYMEERKGSLLKRR